MLYKVKIKRPNKMFTIKNNQVRSPFECTVNELVVQQIKTTIRFHGLAPNDYDIQLISQEVFNDKKKDYSCIPAKKSEEKPKPIEKKKPVKSLNEIQNKNIKIPEPIHKNLKQEEKPPFILKPQFIQKPKEKDQTITTNFVNKIEQNINKTTSVIEEVKIEELTETASALLNKFLNYEL